MPDDRHIPIPFEPLPEDLREAYAAERRDRLRARNELDQARAAAAERGRLERAFFARPVGPTTEGRLP